MGLGLIVVTLLGFYGFYLCCKLLYAIACTLFLPANHPRNLAISRWIKANTR